MKTRRGGFTLIEILIVVVIMAVLAAVIIPQFAGSTEDAQLNTAKVNLRSMRSIIEMYKGQHSGKLPSGDLSELITNTDKLGTPGTGPYGPYVLEIPENPLTGKSDVKPITAADPSGEVTAGGGGWLYNTTSGRIYLDHPVYYTE